MARATSGCQVEEAGQGNGYRKEFRHFNAAYPIARAPRTRPSSPGQTLDRSSQAVPHIRNARVHRTRSNPLRNIHSSVAFEHQFGQDSFPFIAPEEMVVVLAPVLLAPAQDGSDLAAQERGPFGRDEGAGKAGERPPLAIMHLPALAVVEQGDGIACAGDRDGNQRRMPFGQATRKGQVHELSVGRNIPQAGAWQGCHVGRDTAKQDRLLIRSDKRMRAVGQQGQAILGPGHRDVEQAAGGVGIQQGSL